jgi:archaellum component FlaC
MQALLDQTRERNDELAEELDQVRAELDEERKLTATLQGQLNALKELEEQLSLEEVQR